MARLRVSISQVRVCGCSEVCGEVPGSVVRCSKDCGEVVNNWLANLTRAIPMPSCKAGLKSETSNELTAGCGLSLI